jgi:hypothetical protein
MGTSLGNPVSEVPTNARARTENGVTQLCINARPAKWVVYAVFAGMLLFCCLAAVMAALGAVQQNAASPSPWLIVGEVFCGLLILLLILAGLIFILASVMAAEAILKDGLLQLMDRGTRYNIPISQIASIRHVANCGSRLEIDLSGPPSRVFFRGRRTAVEIEVPGGKLHFFRAWEEPKVAWLAAQLNRLIFPDRPGQPADHPSVHQPADNLVVAGSMTGKSARLGASFLFVAAVGMGTALGIPSFRALESRTWPRADGRVLHSKYEERDSGEEKQKTFIAELKYSYAVHGETYTNDDIGTLHDNDDTVVRKLVTGHPDGSSITVYYNPHRPEDSTVLPGVGWAFWFIFALTVLLFLMAIPLSLHRSTPAQDALHRTYRVGPVANDLRDSDRFFAKVRWTMPYDVWKADIRKQRRAALFMAARVLSVTAAALWGARHWLTGLCGPDFPWARMDEMIMAYAALMPLAMFGATFFLGRRPPTYAITSEGLLTPSKEHPLKRWDALASFSIQPTSRATQYRSLILYCKAGVSRRFVLPDAEVESAVVGALSAHLPQGLPPPELQGLSPRDWGLALLLVAAAICGGQNFLIHHLHWLKSNVHLFLLAGLIVGPGSWMALGLWHRRAKPQLIVIAGAINLIATLGTLLSTIVLYLKQEIGQ